MSHADIRNAGRLTQISDLSFAVKLLFDLLFLYKDYFFLKPGKLRSKNLRHPSNIAYDRVRFFLPVTFLFIETLCHGDAKPDNMMFRRIDIELGKY